MHTEKIVGYAIEVPKGSSFSISTPDDQIKLHTITLAIAARGTGKTVALTNLMRILQCQKCMDKVYIISPTVHSNEAMLKQLNAESEDIYEEPCRESILDIVAKVEQEREDYDEYHRKMKMYKRFLKQLSNTSAAYDNELLLTFYNGMDFEPPKHKYNGRKPVLGLLVDDCQGSELFRPKSPFMNMCIKHRHLGKGLGLSLFIACQNYTAQGGIPRAIRNNVTHLMLFKLKDNKVLDEIGEEIGGEITREQFEQVYAFAIQQPHDFLLIDFAPKPTHKSRFRRNFNEYIVLDNNVGIK